MVGGPPIEGQEAHADAHELDMASLFNPMNIKSHKNVIIGDQVHVQSNAREVMTGQNELQIVSCSTRIKIKIHKKLIEQFNRNRPHLSTFTRTIPFLKPQALTLRTEMSKTTLSWNGGYVNSSSLIFKAPLSAAHTQTTTIISITQVDHPKSYKNEDNQMRAPEKKRKILE